MTEFEDAEFWDYIITDENGNMAGVQDDMPQSAWPDYEGFLEEQRLAKRQNIKI